MADLDTRLRADAARRTTVGPPSLDAALDQVGVEGHRIRPLALAAAAAVVLLVAGVAVALSTLQSHHAPQPAAPSNHDRKQSHPARHGPAVLRPVSDYGPWGVLGVLAVPGDPTAYDVIVPSLPHNRRERCGLYDPRVSVVQQSATTVRLRVSGKIYEEDLGHGKYRSYGCAAGTGKPLRVRLKSPIGNRVLYDHGHQRVMVVDPNDYPDFGWVPPGYQRKGGHRPGSDLTAPEGKRRYDLQRYDCPGRVMDDRTGPPRPCDAMLILTIGALGPPDGFGSHLQKVSINGFPAVLTTTYRPLFDSGCVTWREAPSAHGRQVCMQDVAHLDIQDLLRAARSVH